MELTLPYIDMLEYSAPARDTSTLSELQVLNSSYPHQQSVRDTQPGETSRTEIARANRRYDLEIKAPTLFREEVEALLIP
jgi:hypothetical protein